MDLKKIHSKVCVLLSENKIEDALQLLQKQCSQKELTNEIISLYNRYISSEELEKRQNKLVHNILSINDKLSLIKEDIDIELPLKKFRNSLEHAIIRVKVSEILLDAYQKDQYLSVSAIHQLIGKRRNRAFLMQFLNEMLSFNFIEKKYDKRTGTSWEITEEGKNYLSKWKGN